MAVDFDRSSSSLITSSTVPMVYPFKPIILECWCKIGSLASSGGITYGYLCGQFHTGADLFVALRIKEDGSGIPTRWYAQMVVKTNLGEYVSESAYLASPTSWNHILGYWTAGNYVYVVTNGVLGGSVNPAGLLIGLTEYAIGGHSDIGAGTYDHFDGQIAEVATWSLGVTGGSLEAIKAAHLGRQPIHRDPFYYGGEYLLSWLPMHNVGTNQDVMRPGIIYVESNVSSYEGHPPIIQPLMTIQRGGPAVEVVALQRMGVPMSPTLII